jgi:hypothetical protein
MLVLVRCSFRCFHEVVVVSRQEHPMHLPPPTTALPSMHRGPNSFLLPRDPSFPSWPTFSLPSFSTIPEDDLLLGRVWLRDALQPGALPWASQITVQFRVPFHYIGIATPQPPQLEASHLFDNTHIHHQHHHHILWTGHAPRGSPAAIHYCKAWVRTGGGVGSGPGTSPLALALALTGTLTPAA